MPITLGGPTARKIINRADMTCAFHYVQGEEAACFYSKYRRDSGGRPAGAYIIPLSSAWQYTEQPYLFTAATKAAEVMGFDPYSRGDVYKIMDFIQDMLIELCTMQPAPDSMSERPPLDVQQDGNRIIVTSDRLH